MKKRLPDNGDERLPPESAFLLYTAEDGRTRLDCRFDGQTIWLTQAQIADLFQTSVPNINLHLKAVFAEQELDEAATVKSYLIVRTEHENARFHARRLEWEEQAATADFEKTINQLPTPPRKKLR